MVLVERGQTNTKKLEHSRVDGTVVLNPGSGAGRIRVRGAKR
jgi:hypothetical protein